MVRAGKREMQYLKTDRTEVATLRAKGAWNVVEPETSRTDCVASATGPKLLHC